MISKTLTLNGLSLVITCASVLFYVPADASQTVLLKHLMKDYNKEVRPLVNNEPTKVLLNIALVKIILVEEKQEALTTNIWISLFWKDKRLSWNRTKFNDIEIITLHPEKAWVPDIDLLNRVERSDKIGDIETRLKATYEGDVSWMLQTIYRSSCSIDIKYFPFDDQTCPLTFGSFTYNKKELEIVPRHKNAETGFYEVNGEWTLLSTKAQEMSTKYSYSNHEYSVVKYDIAMRRQTLYYMMNFIVPCVLIAILTVPVLLLPPESQERQSYGVTVLLSFTILIMMLQEKIPATSRVYPMIAIYYACTIVQVSVVMLMSTAMLCFYHKRPLTIPVPKWVKVVVLTWCAKLVGLHDSVDKVKQKLYATAWKQVAIRKSRHDSCGIKEITERVINTQEESIRQEEWHVAAYIVNRFFAWMYVFTIFLTFFVVFFNSPRAKEGTL